MPGNTAAARFVNLYLHCRDMNDVMYDAKGAREGPYGSMQGPIRVHVRAYIGLHERAIMDFQSRSISLGS